MPFTGAHPAILFPARWIKPALISWTALIIGSMVPDAEYFLWMNSGSYISHTLWGILVFNLPLTFLIAFAWHSFIRKSLIPRLPFLKPKFRSIYIYNFPEWLRKNYLVFIISAFAGIMSHLIWDSFCHAKGFMVKRIPFLIEYARIAGHQIRWCYVLWYISTLIGLIYVFAILIDGNALFKKEQWRLIGREKKFWRKVFLTAIILASIRIAMGLNQNVPRHLVIITISSILYGILIISYINRDLKKAN